MYRGENMRQKRSQAVVIFVTVLLALLLIGCSSTPSSSAAEEFIRNRIKEESGDKIKLISFKKINGQETAPGGVPSYNFEYEAEIEFVENCQWGTKYDYFGTWRGDFAVFPPKDEPGYFGGMFAPFGEATTGSRTKVKAYVVFRKTEAGWIPEKPSMF